MARGHPCREQVAVYGEGVASRHARLSRGFEQQGAEPPQFLFQQPRGGPLLLGFEGIAANQLGQPVRLVGRGVARGAHLEQDGSQAPARDLPRGFGARQAPS